MSKYLDKLAILGSADVKTEEVSVPEWGGTVLVRGMTAAARDAWEQMLVKDGKSSLENARAKLVAVSVVDEAGNLVFSESDVVLLGAKSASALSRIATAAQRLSRLSVADIEDAAKN